MFYNGDLCKCLQNIWSGVNVNDKRICYQCTWCHNKTENKIKWAADDDNNDEYCTAFGNMNVYVYM